MLVYRLYFLVLLSASAAKIIHLRVMRKIEETETPFINSVSACTRRLVSLEISRLNFPALIASVTHQIAEGSLFSRYF